MSSLDVSAGLSAKDIDSIKYNIKKQISSELPELPDIVETQLFLQGRSPWNFYWRLLDSNAPIAPNVTISFEVTVKLKREFHHHGATTHHTFLCKVRTTGDAYHPSVSVLRIA